MSLENELLKLRMGRVAADEATQTVAACVARDQADVESEYTARVQPRLITLTPDCRSALSTLRIDTLAHFEVFIEPGESLQRQAARVNASAQKLRAAAAKARLICESG